VNILRDNVARNPFTNACGLSASFLSKYPCMLLLRSRKNSKGERLNAKERCKIELDVSQ